MITVNYTGLIEKLKAERAKIDAILAILDAASMTDNVRDDMNDPQLWIGTATQSIPVVTTPYVANSGVAVMGSNVK